MKIFSDAASEDSLVWAASNPEIEGVTTNPTILQKAGVGNYRDFAQKACEILGPKPLSLEVVSDSVESMKMEAHEISTWGENIFVKVPIVNSVGESTMETILQLIDSGVNLNVTAVMTEAQIDSFFSSIPQNTKAILSIFAGRIADTLRNPATFINRAKNAKLDRGMDGVEILWASTRQIFDVSTAEKAGADIITIAPELLKKLELKGKDLNQYSIETAKMFFDDASAAGLKVF